MTLMLSQEMLGAAYDYLRTTPPFNRWNLPESEDVLFRISHRPGEFGRYTWDGRQHTISASSKMIGYTGTLMTYMAHEMIHLHLEETGMESRRGGSDTHNAAFRKFAGQVCKAHGFDPKSFY